jgi:hypothetical protein
MAAEAALSPPPSKLHRANPPAPDYATGSMRSLAPILCLLAACAKPPADADAPFDTAHPVEGVVARITQLDLPASALGEAALITTGDRSVLIDVGNDSHQDEVRDALDVAGLDGAVDWVILTHLDADHIGAVEELFGPGGVTVNEGIIWRGRRNLGSANQGELLGLLDILEDTPDLGLCDEDGCDGLPLTLDLGAAQLTLFLADGQLATDSGVVDLPVALTEENARSLAGVLRVGAFSYLFAGDLTGGGKDSPDVEGAVVDRLGDLPWIDANAVDVMQLNHHGISTSTSPAWAEAMLGSGPSHAVMGANGMYLDAPSEEALDALAPHLGGGRVWATRTGLLGQGEVTEVEGPVTIEVHADGWFDVVAEGEVSERVGQQAR